MVKINIRVYIDKYDVQGTPLEIETDDIKNKQDWENTKQKLINEFINQFNMGNIKVKGQTVSKLLEGGFYKETKLNRQLRRVGLPYKGKGAKLVDAVKSMIENKDFGIQNEGRIRELIEKPQPLIEVKPELQFKRRPWLDKEIEMLKNLREKGITFRGIGMRLFRSPSSVSSKFRRISI